MYNAQLEENLASGSLSNNVACVTNTGIMRSSLKWTNPLIKKQPDYNNNNTTTRRSRSPSRDRNASNNNYRDNRSPANGYERRPSRSEQPAGNMDDRQNSQQDRRVYVGNLSYDVKWHHLKDHMREGMRNPSNSFYSLAQMY